MASHLRHIKVLQQEEKKLSPNKRIITDLMVRTYPLRRKEIMEDPQPIQQLFITYPSLKRSEQVKIQTFMVSELNPSIHPYLC